MLIANKPAQVKSLLHSLEQAARGIGVNGNSNKTELMYFNQDDAVSLNGKPLKLADKIVYLGSKILSTKNDVNISIGKG